MRLANFLTGTVSYTSDKEYSEWIEIVKMYRQPHQSEKSSDSNRVWNLKCTDLPQFDALEAQANLFRTDDKFHLRNLCNDTSRCTGLIAKHNSSGNRTIILDYSRQRVTGESVALLFHMADSVGFAARREAMRTGQRINLSEDRPVMHHVFRMPADFKFVIKEDPSPPRSPSNGALDGAEVLADVVHTRDQIRVFSEKARGGSYKSAMHQRFLNTLVVGAEGFRPGPTFVTDALQADPLALEKSSGRTIRFLANVDPVNFYSMTMDLDPAETLVVINTKDMTNAETALNARTVRNWLVKNMHRVSEREVIAKHFVAVTKDDSWCEQFGIRPENVFLLPDWINTRFSVTSPTGILPLALHFSYTVVSELLMGAHDMDKHFFHTPLRDNIPVILGLLGVWNSTFLGYPCRATLPYSHALRSFTAYIQHVEMESNGKRVAQDGSDLSHRSGEVNFGIPGSNAQHMIMQLMHQGRPVPAEFIGFMESQHPLDLEEEAVSNHDELMSNFFAQPDALAYGKTMVDLVQEGTPEHVREHMVLTGNRPSSSILMTRLDAFAVGQLLAIYEHRTVVQGFIWGINSFDQFGNELGRMLAKHVRSTLSASRKTGASVQGFNSSTSSLLESYLAHNKQTS